MDNYYHAQVKRRYWSYIASEKGAIGLEKNINIICKSIFDEKEASIRNYFGNCGLTGNLGARESVKHLLNEGLYPAKKFRKIHKKQLLAYVNSRWKGKKSIKDVFGSDFENLFDQK